MRILCFIDSLFPSGAERSLAAIAPHLVSSGCDLEVAYFTEKPGLHAELEQAGAHVVRVEGKSRAAWLGNATRLARRRRPDLIHTTLFEADIAGRVAGFVARVPVVSSLVNLAYGSEQTKDQGLVRWKIAAAKYLDATTARTVTRFHALTRHVAHVMSRRLRISLKRMDIVPRGREPSELGLRSQDRRVAARKKIGANAEDIVILAVARQEYQKGLDVLLDAFPLLLGHLPTARLTLSGREGAATDVLREKATLFGHRARFLGARDDVPDLMCAADVVVLPSRWEGFGGVLLEAMALEAPIVASDLPAIRDVLDDGACGSLVPPEQPEKLAEAIVSTVLAPKETERKVRLARARFLEDYTVDRVAAQMLKFYERALSQSKGGLLTAISRGA